MTTMAVFVIAAAILYLARVAVFILLLSLLFAYLLEPAVALIQRHSRLGGRNRSWAIAQVYFAGVLILGSLGYEFAPRLIEQMNSLNAALPQILNGLSNDKAAADLGAKRGLSLAQQQRIRDWLARSHDLIIAVVERGAASAVSLAASAIWLFAVPILAIFILRDGHQLVGSIVQALGLRRDQTQVRRILVQIDTMLARYVRAQLAMAGLSFIFYSTVMLVLKFPYALALGFLGGVLEFLPAIGWLASAACILTVGSLTQAHWIWMAALLVLWRFIQNYVNSPRIMGNNLQLQPLTVLFALMVGGQVGGIAGVYLSVPITAALRIVWLGYLAGGDSAEPLSKPALTQGEA